MKLFKTRTSSRLIGLIAIAATGTGCQSAAQIPHTSVSTSAIPSGTACQKADAMWREKILPSRYAQLPPLTSPGIAGLIKLMTNRFSVKALTSNGDELEPGRRKLIHAFGAEARMRLVVSPKAMQGYTGIFQSGAECAIARFSRKVTSVSTSVTQKRYRVDIVSPIAMWTRYRVDVTFMSPMSARRDRVPDVPGNSSHRGQHVAGQTNE